jgi:hypothetical protein
MAVYLENRSQESEARSQEKKLSFFVVKAVHGKSCTILDKALILPCLTQRGLVQNLS